MEGGRIVVECLLVFESAKLPNRTEWEHECFIELPAKPSVGDRLLVAGNEFLVKYVLFDVDTDALWIQACCDVSMTKEEFDAFEKNAVKVHHPRD